MKAFIDNMGRKDYLVLAGIVLITAISAVLLDRRVKAVNEATAEALTGQTYISTVIALSVAMVAAIAVIYYCARVYGGTVGKGFYMFVWGALFQLSLPIEIVWHILGLPASVGPAWLGISPYWWLGFWHAAIAVSIALMGYGFYLLVQDFSET